MANRVAMLELSMNMLQANTIVGASSLKAQMSTAPNIAGGKQREDHSKVKPITESKAVSEFASWERENDVSRLEYQICTGAYIQK